MPIATRHKGGDGGCFGEWRNDADGLPCFALEPCGFTDDLILPESDPRAPWHHIGNDAVTLTARLDGSFDIWWSADGLVCLTRPIREKGRRAWKVTGDDPASLRCELGVDYLRTSITTDVGVLTRTVWVPAGDRSLVLIDLEIAASRARREETAGSEYREFFDFAPLPIAIGGLMSRWTPSPSSATRAGRLAWNAIFAGTTVSREATEVARRVLSLRTMLTEHAPLDLDLPHVLLGPRSTALRSQPSPTHRSQPSPTWVPRLNESIAVAVLDGRAGSSVDCEGSMGVVRVTVRAPLAKPPAPRLCRVAIAIGEVAELPSLLEAAAVADHAESARHYRSLASLKAPAAQPGSPLHAVAREVTWHAAALKGSVMEDRVMGRRFVPQGSAYTFLHGIQGAPRDYAITAVPLTFLDPALAAEQVRTILYMSRHDGALEYAHTGAGRVTSAGIHPTPSDLPIFLLWCLADHVWATGNTAFLGESLRYHDGSSATVAERALASWSWLRDRIGTGPHGLLRVGSGDWSDPIALMVRSSRAFHRRGESTFNTAMACYVLPRAARLLEGHDSKEAASMRSLASDLRRALDDAWIGKWYLRGWDGLGAPIGEEHLFLDANAWCLIADAGEQGHEDPDNGDRAGRGRALAAEIGRLCDDPSPYGATLVDRPHPVRFGALPPGWDCNGGVWAAINAFLAWGYALHDPQRAWRFLAKQGLAAHAVAFPHIWYGIWSGPDAYNSYMGDREGETFVQPATPMAEWPVANSNAHAGPLLALLKVLGVEAGPNGIACHPHLPEDVGPLRLSTPLAEITVAASGEARIERRDS